VQRHAEIVCQCGGLMPAGDTRKTLIEMYPLVFDMCAEKGYNMTGRDHIIAFDTKRGV
jgi:7-carboxy-7-deazaguanine synthase